MERGKINSTDRLLDFAVAIMGVVNRLPKTFIGQHIGKQLFRSGTSSGANYEEACGAGSKADFTYKLNIVLKELKESRFWSTLIDRSKIVDSKYVQPIFNECEELCAIIAKSIVTVKKNK